MCEQSKNDKGVVCLIRSANHDPIAVLPVLFRAGIGQKAEGVPCQKREAGGPDEEERDVDDEVEEGREKGADVNAGRQSEAKKCGD